jgi:hypothetical protein
MIKKFWKFKVRNGNEYSLSSFWFNWQSLYTIITQAIPFIIPSQNYSRILFNRQITSLRIHTHMVK